MKTNTEYYHIKESFSSLLLLSINKNRHKMFMYEKNNWLYKNGYVDLYFNNDGLHISLTNIADTLFEKGYCYVYCDIVKEDKKRKFIFEIINDKSNLKKIDKKSVFKLKLPLLKRFKVRNIKKKICSIEKYRHYSDFDNKLKYFVEQEQYKELAIAKLVHDFYIDTYKTNLYNDYYYTIKLINTRINQLRYIEFIIMQVNCIIKKVTDIENYISFNGFTKGELNEMKANLENNKTSITDTIHKIYEKEN